MKENKKFALMCGSICILNIPFIMLGGFGNTFIFAVYGVIGLLCWFDKIK